MRKWKLAVLTIMLTLIIGVWGFAAGEAEASTAALAVQTGIRPRDLDTGRLREQLRSDGVYLGEQ